MDLEDRIAKTLDRQGISCEWKRLADERRDMDGEALLLWDDRRLMLPYLVRPQLRPSTVGLLPQDPQTGMLVLSDYITASVGKLLRDRGLNYADAAGNAYLRAPGFRFHSEGFRPPPSSGSTTGNLFSSSAMPLILAILNRPELVHSTVRELQARTHVSVGTTHRVQKQLHTTGYVNTPMEDSSAPNRIRWRRLLEGWLSAFGTLREDIIIGKFSSDLDQTALLSAAPRLPADLSGEFAAHVAGADIIPATADFYVEGSASTLIRAARLRPDPEGPFTVRKAIWTPLTTKDSRHSQPNLAPSPVIYADIASISDPRTEMLAKDWLIHDKNLRSFIID